METRVLMLRKRRFARVEKTLGPLMTSTLRQQRKLYEAPDQPQGRPTALVASYNIHKCVGVDGRFNPMRIMSVLREIDADLVALQEVDQRFGDRAGLLDLHAVERECGLRPVDVSGTRASHGGRGNLVLVRGGEVESVSQLALPGAEPRGALVVDLRLKGRPLRVIAAHLGLLRRSRASQIKALLAAADAPDGRPALLMGDLNEWRLGTRSSLQALAPRFGPLGASVASFPSRFPVWSLDRILAAPDTMVARITVHDTPLAHVASDHLPLKAQLHLDSVAAESAEGGALAASA